KKGNSFPSIVVTKLPSGSTHFVVLWKRYGPFLQLMDPASGRRLTTWKKLQNDLHLHTQSVPAAEFRAWAATPEFTEVLLERLRNLGTARPPGDYVEKALQDPGWQTIAQLDASVRVVQALVSTKVLAPGAAASKLLDQFVAGPAGTVPPSYWSVKIDPEAKDSGQTLAYTGAVLLKLRGRTEADVAAALAAGKREDEGPLAADVKSSLATDSLRPVAVLWSAMREDGHKLPLLLGLGLLMLVAGSLAEVVLLRGLLDLTRELRLPGQRAAGLAGLGVLTVALILVELPVAMGVQRMGRRLEVRLRWYMMAKLPLIDDRYFQSRLTSDMASRTHAIQGVRGLPRQLSQFLLTTVELIATTAALIWLSPSSWLLAVLSCLILMSLSVVLTALLSEADLRMQVHGGALSRSYLDAMLGLSAVRVSRGERTLRREHEGMLVEWARAGLSLQKLVMLIEGVVLLGSTLFAVGLVRGYLSAPGHAAGSVLLVVFWALRQQGLGLRLSATARTWPSIKNRVARLIEPLGAAGDPLPQGPPVTSEAVKGVRLDLRKVAVRAGGHLLLDDIDLVVEPGAHIAVVGSSGAGKSTLVGLFLGWHKPASGELLVDGKPLTPEVLTGLRQRTAWVDPAVQLWNQSCLNNLRYGVPPEHPLSLGEVFAAADLQSVLEALPDGLQTKLGEGGGLVSGGQGQRVRLGRALLRPGVRLALLDEPFRGLDRDKRKKLMDEARRIWADATLFCVSHDVGMTAGFDQVVVVEQGRIVEMAP
ncbi:MAG TPA: ABC transporter ATP-binding protein, partial [Myxococcales bacterium]|nr:ABC transporter ATP-binding protein [Myxococcales bacterium]